MVEYLKDSIEMDPGEAFPAEMLKNGVQFRGTGDKVIDEWEKQLADGNTPDFVKDMKIAAEDKALVEAWLKPKKKPEGGGSTPPTIVTTAPPVHVPEVNPSDDELPEWMKEYVDTDVTETFKKKE